MKKTFITCLFVLGFSLLLISYTANAYMPAENMASTPNVTTMPWGPSEKDQNREYAYDIQMQFKDSEVTLQQGAKYRTELVRFDCVRKGWAVGIYSKKELKKMTKDGQLTYVSTNPKIARVSSNGVISAIGTGKTVIDVYYREAPHLEEGNDGYAKTSIPVSVTKNKISLNKRSIKIKTNKKTYLKLRKYPNNVINRTTYGVNKKNIVKIKNVSGNKLQIIGKKKGKVIITVNVLGKKLKCRIVVK